jgi:hypothetical protein
MAWRKETHVHVGCLVVLAARAVAATMSPASGLPGDWPTPRQNRHLTAAQPLAGKMRSAPQVVARLSLGQTQGQLHPFASGPGGAVDRVLGISDGSARCYRLDGRLLWEKHPPGLNFEQLVAAEDLDGDGHVELVLTAGRPGQPLGAMVLADAATGRVRFRYDVEPMSYSWFVQVDHFLPGVTGKQMVVCMHGYPPDKKNGYLALFDFPELGHKPRRRWRYDFDQYTCFPTLLTVDVNRDGIKELCVETHSRMWVLDPRSGQVLQFVPWDVAPGNVRSYGLVRFQDLNGDGWPDFFCIASFAQHHEVLLNDHGHLKLAWAHGWDNSVTTSKIATTWPEPPIADVDGDGRLEMVVSMFNAEAEPRWMIRVYDAVTGALKAKVMDRIAVAVADVDGDGAAEILADISTDPTRTAVTGACLLHWTAGGCKEVWHGEGARSVSRPPQPRKKRAGTRDPMAVVVSGHTKRLMWTAGRGARLVQIADASQTPGPDLSRIPATVGPTVGPPLVADLDGDGVNEVLLYRNSRVSIYHHDRRRGLVESGSYPSDGAPAIADLDGDGRPELILGSASATTEPVIRAIQPAKGGRLLWEATLPRPDHPGMPYGRALYFQTGRFTGKRSDDLYVYVGTPVVRSLLLDGRTGARIWERDEVPGTERYFAPTVNLAAVYDVNGDGCDDLVFTNPDYYCVASGPSGEALVGPVIPSRIFSQPSQGLYTLPAILDDGRREPTVCLVDGHYFVGVMTAHARPLWYRLPEVGEARTGAEGFLRLPDGRWLMGFGRQNGRFACVEVATGKLRWELPIDAAASDVSACDIDGDGRPEFLFGTSHGDLYAVGDEGDHARVLWKVHFPASVGMPVIADVDGDGAPEILAVTGDGYLCLLRGR